MTIIKRNIIGISLAAVAIVILSYVLLEITPMLTTNSEDLSGSKWIRILFTLLYNIILVLPVVVMGTILKKWVFPIGMLTGLIGGCLLVLTNYLLIGLTPELAMSSIGIIKFAIYCGIAAVIGQWTGQRLSSNNSFKKDAQ